MSITYDVVVINKDEGQLSDFIQCNRLFSQYTEDINTCFPHDEEYTCSNTGSNTCSEHRAIPIPKP